MLEALRLEVASLVKSHELWNEGSTADLRSIHDRALDTQRSLDVLNQALQRFSQAQNELLRGTYAFAYSVGSIRGRAAQFTDDLGKGPEPLIKNYVNTNGPPLRIHFFFQMPEVWTTWESVWAACCAHPDIEATLVLLPFHHDSKVDETRARKFLVERGIRFVDCSIYDVAAQAPDIAFVQNPYDSTRPESFAMEHLIEASIRVVYIPYGLDIGGGEDNLRWQYDLNVQRGAWRIFVRSEAHARMYGLYCKSGNEHVRVTGHPKIDKIVALRDRDSENRGGATQERDKIILWCPHFSVEHGGWSTFGRFADGILSYFENQPKGCRLLVRPHPLFFGRMRQIESEEAVLALMARFNQPPYIQMDEQGQYEDAFTQSDALMTDAGSFLLEYLPTMKPILYLDNPEGPGLNESASFVDHYYRAREFEDVLAYLEMIRNGDDPRREQRASMIESQLFSADGRAGTRIVDEIVSGYRREIGVTPFQAEGEQR